jgi:hypothetical protein
MIWQRLKNGLFTNLFLSFWVSIGKVLMQFPHVFVVCIINLTCDKLIMKIVQSSFIHRLYILHTKYHALKTCVTHEWMNKCHMNFASFYKYVCQMCFLCTISMLEMYELWMNEFCTIFIIKLWNTKFVMCLKLQKSYQSTFILFYFQLWFERF